jgi:hypothetical protein
LLWELVALGSQAGATFGVLVGTPLTFLLLRRVPLLRIAANAFMAATYAGIVGYAFSLPFSQPRPSVGFMLAGSCAGLAVAAVHLWRKFRSPHTAATASSDGVTA